MEKDPPNCQPSDSTVVWQHNRLAEARYELSPREQKLLLYVIAMIEPDDADFKRYQVDIAHFAKLARLDPKNLYLELRELAKNLISKPVVIPDHFDAESGKTGELITSWFSAAFVTPNGEGYFVVEISRKLRPYLLQVKREFFRYRLQQVMCFRSAYAIRLYQFAKRWEFRGKVEIPLHELRQVLGSQTIKRGKIEATLSSYADFKRRAIQPAVDEINDKADVIISFREGKAPGSKAVQSLWFSIVAKDNAASVDHLPLPPVPQLELELNDDDDSGEKAIGELRAKYLLNEIQVRKVQEYYQSRGRNYVLEKAAIVDRVERDNPAQAFLAALRDNWQPTPPKKSKAVKPRKAKEQSQAREEMPARIPGRFNSIIQTIKSGAGQS